MQREGCRRGQPPLQRRKIAGGFALGAPDCAFVARRVDRPLVDGVEGWLVVSYPCRNGDE